MYNDCLIKSSGIYCIKNNVNGKVYIGSAENLRKRCGQHAISARKGAGNIKLQRAYKKYGAQNFSFIPLFLCKKQDLLFYEERAISGYSSVSGGYNCRRKPDSNIGIKLPMSEETKRKIGAANAIALAGRMGPMPIGGKHKEESKIKMSVSKRKIFTQYEYSGRKMCLSDWADSIGISVRGLGNRIKRGWPLDRALSEKSRGY